MKIIYIYKLIAPNGKIYIGQTNNIRGMLRRHLNSNYPIGNALREYEPINFKISILHKTYDRKTANELEILEIEQHNCIRPNGYNICKGGDGGAPFTGHKHSEEAIKKISESEKGKHKGKILSEETIKKISLNRKGKCIGNQNAKGKHWPEESKKNRSINNPMKNKINILKMRIGCLKHYIEKFEKELNI